MRWPPRIGMVSPGIWARADCHEFILAVVIGNHATGTGKIWVKRRRMLITLVNITSGSICLPHLDELITHGATLAIDDLAGDRNALPQWFSVVVQGQIRFNRGNIVMA